GRPLRDLRQARLEEDGRACRVPGKRDPNQKTRQQRRRHMTIKTLTPIFVLPLVSVAALTLALSMGASVSGSSERDRALHVTKECSEYTGAAGSFCTITSSNLARIEVGSRVHYDQPAGIPAGLLDS